MNKDEIIARLPLQVKPSNKKTSAEYVKPQNSYLKPGTQVFGVCRCIHLIDGLLNDSLLVDHIADA